MDQVNNLPLMNPEIVTAIGFMLLFITFRVEKGYVTMLLGAHCILYSVCHAFGYAEDPLTGSESGRCGDGPWGNTVAGADESYCSADHTGNRLRCTDCIYHVGR